MSQHYTNAKAHLAEGETLHAEVEALLYIGEQIEVATGVLFQIAEKAGNGIGSEVPPPPAWRPTGPRRKD